MLPLDQVQLNFSPEALSFINWMLGLVVFGVALDLRPQDFLRVLKQPRAPAVGLLCQFLLMPALASVLVWIWQPAPSIGLGIILVSACPGGNISNFLTQYSGGNTALSVSMSAVSTLVAIVMTPLNFSLWGQANPVTRDLMSSIALNPIDILNSVLMILVLPTLAGMALRHFQADIAKRLQKPMQRLSLLVMIAFIVGSLYANYEFFLPYIGSAFGIVLIVNTAGLLLGYGLTRACGLGEANARAVSFETGIQNSGFGLLLIFNFFPGLGGMAIVAAWWGVWHLLSGMTLAQYWARPSAGPQARLRQASNLR